MADTQKALHTYQGKCLCGDFVFEAKLPEVKTGYGCSCSICHKRGGLWQFPAADDFKFIKGDENNLAIYKFGSRKYSHESCPTCGTTLLCSKVNESTGKKEPAINARTLEGLDVFSLNVDIYDGAALPPLYEPPVFTGPEPTADVEGGKVYHGSCHCGAVKTAVKVKPLDENYKDRMMEGDCSICSRGAYVWIYPNKDQVVIEGRDNLTYYVPPGSFWRKGFCKHCGVHVLSEVNPLSDEELAARPESERDFREDMKDVMPLTARMLNDVDFTKLKPTRYSCAHGMKKYC